MLETKNRKLKILGAGWLGLGGLAFPVVVIASFQLLFSFAQGNAPEDGYVEGSVFVLVFLVVGTICLVNGLALLRRSAPHFGHIVFGPPCPVHYLGSPVGGRGAQPMAHAIQRWQGGI